MNRVRVMHVSNPEWQFLQKVVRLVVLEQACNKLELLPS